jgi:type II secretory pathway pseudopilin PulG
MNMMKQRGFGYIEIVIVLAVVAAAGYLLMQYFTSTAKTVEKLQQDRPLARTKLAADQATLTTVQGLVRSYQAEKGQFPPTRRRSSAAAGPPRFQCPGNDFEYDPATARSASRSPTTRAAELTRLASPVRS